MDKKQRDRHRPRCFNFYSESCPGSFNFTLGGKAASKRSASASSMK